MTQTKQRANRAAIFGYLSGLFLIFIPILTVESMNAWILIPSVIIGAAFYALAIRAEVKG